MSDELFRLIYVSRNTSREEGAGVEDEAGRILRASRRNNPVRRVTGALLYNSDCFAQVLEGPLAEVEQVFELIQRDPRHADVTVLDAGPVPARDFPEWAMASTGAVEADAASFAGFAEAPPGAGAADVLQLLRTLAARGV